MFLLWGWDAPKAHLFQLILIQFHLVWGWVTPKAHFYQFFENNVVHGDTTFREKKHRKKEK